MACEDVAAPPLERAVGPWLPEQEGRSVLDVSLLWDFANLLDDKLAFRSDLLELEIQHGTFFLYNLTIAFRRCDQKLVKLDILPLPL